MIDITSAPYNVRGDNANDDGPGIQRAIDTLFAKHRGGIVDIPPGTYYASNGLMLRGGVILQGSGLGCTQINVGDKDVTTVAFDATCFNAALRDLFIVGKRTRPVNSNAVSIAKNVAVSIRDCYLWFGYSGLFTQGVDCRLYDCFIAGLEAGIASNGANWYVNCKLDSIDKKIPRSWGLLQGALDDTLLENHFTQCDFSGDFATAVQINDMQGPQSVTVFDGCVFSADVEVGKSRWTSLNHCEIGGAVNCSMRWPTSVIGCYGMTPMTIANAVKAGNVNIS